MKKLIVIGLAVLFLAGTATADWDAPKWVQLPDVTTNGLDIRASSGVVLADDFLCTESSLITDIHIWGSWLNDQLPLNAQQNPDPANVTFTLSIHADVPPTPGGADYSMPGEIPLWYQTFAPGQFQVRPYLTGIKEGWYDPSTGTYLPSEPTPAGGGTPAPADTICWQYNFLIDPATAFEQIGTPSQPIVYWLDVQATSGDPAAWFGWKSSLQHWNDDAVWGTGIEPKVGGWGDLKYPDGHPLYDKSIDLAFVITPEPATLILLGMGGLMALTRKKGSAGKIAE